MNFPKHDDQEDRNPRSSQKKATVLPPKTIKKKYEALLGEVGAKIAEYDKTFNIKELSVAIDWDKAAKEEEATRKTKHKRPKTIDDYFSDPLQIIKILVEEFHADRDTILATALYRAVRTTNGDPPDQAKLDKIEKQFGKSVRRLVDRTLRLRALKMPSLTAGTEQPVDEKLSLFRLMGLWVAEDPRAILIRGVQLAANLKREIAAREANRELFSQEQLTSMIALAENFHAPLDYIAGYSKLRTKLLNLCFEIKDSEGYKKTCHTIDRAVEDRSKDHAEVKAILGSYLEEKFGWEKGTHFGKSMYFDIECRKKSAISAFLKAKRKKQKVEDLNDLFGARIILKLPVIKGMEGQKAEDLSPVEQEALMEGLGKQCLRVYSKLSEEFGRGNKKKTNIRINPQTRREERFSYIQERLAQLAKANGGKDGLFDNYIKNPKESGYSAVQDVFFILLSNGKWVEFELQIVDKLRDDHNTYGPHAGHVYYKTGLGKYAQAVIEWYATVRIEWNKAAQELLGNKTAEDKKQERVYVYAGDDRVLEITENPTLSGYLAAAQEVTDNAGAAKEYKITNGYDYAVVTSDPTIRIYNGCRVTAFAA